MINLPDQHQQACLAHARIPLAPPHLAVKGGRPISSARVKMWVRNDDGFDAPKPVNSRQEAGHEGHAVPEHVALLSDQQVGDLANPQAGDGAHAPEIVIHPLQRVHERPIAQIVLRQPLLNAAAVVTDVLPVVLAYAAGIGGPALPLVLGPACHAGVYRHPSMPCCSPKFVFKGFGGGQFF